MPHDTVKNKPTIKKYRYMTQTQNTVRLVTASAGSGKTYRLTKEFLAAVLDRNVPWRETLAVTFTNKATAEMKGRITEALAAEAAGSGPRAEKAGAVLRDMLHHYGEAGVGTIDSYLQKAARTLEGAAKVELDEETVIADVAERVMADAAGDEGLMARLRGEALRQVEGGKTWDITGRLKEMARRFLDEPFLLSLLHGSVVTDPAGVDAVAERAATMMAAFEQRVRETGEHGLQAMEAEGRSPEDYKGKSRSPMTAFRAWAAGTVKEPSAKFAACQEETAGTAVEEAVIKAVELFDAPYREYRTAKVIADSIPALTLWSAIWRAFDEVLAEKGIAMLRRSAARLARSAQDDESYIQQRTGRRVTALLVDEAQDTSVLQWENLRRIAREALSRGGEVLAVGDVKQSIYRWRGGDWRLLSHGMPDSMPEAAFSREGLDENWRSGSAVVEANNEIFGGIADQIERCAPASAAEAIRGAFADARQAMPAARGGARTGYVRIEALDKEAWREEALTRSVADLRRMHDQGYRWKDMTILVRKNREGGDVARRLVEEEIPVITEDGLQACSNACTQRAAAALRLAAHGDDAIARLAADGVAVPQGATLYDMAVDAIRNANPSDADQAYVQVLADQAMAWQQQRGSDIAAFCDWWDERGSHKSIGSGDGADAVRVMTMHKSKGLGLECVVIPFAGDPLTTPAMLAPTIWCRAQGSFADLGLVPVRAFEKTLAGTDLEGDFQEERALQWMDAVNALYVAMTRAKSRLYVYMPQETAKPTTIAYLVQMVLGFPEEPWERGAEEAVEMDESPVTMAPMAPVMAGGHVPVTVLLRGEEYFAGTLDEEEIEF